MSKSRTPEYELIDRIIADIIEQGWIVADRDEGLTMVDTAGITLLAAPLVEANKRVAEMEAVVARLPKCWELDYSGEAERSGR